MAHESANAEARLLRESLAEGFAPLIEDEAAMRFMRGLRSDMSEGAMGLNTVPLGVAYRAMLAFARRKNEARAHQVDAPYINHPERTPSDRSLVCGRTEMIPIYKRVLPCFILNETGISTLETIDRGGRKRGGIVIASSSHLADEGIATIASIDEAKVTVKLLELAIADAERIERGEQPLAQEGLPRRDN